jgi:hypothetical protein
MYLLRLILFLSDISVNLHKASIVSVSALNSNKVRVTTCALTSSFSPPHPVVNVVTPTGDNNPNFSSLNVDILDIEFNAAKVVV